MKRSDARPCGPTRLDDHFITEDEELQEDKAQERGKCSFRQQQREMQRYDRFAHSSLLASNNNVPHDKTVISFRLSNCPPNKDAWKVKEYMHVDETSGQWTHESSEPGSIQFGLIRLSMDAWGGRSLDEGGRRIRSWSWTDQAQTPTPLRPLFLSLNRNTGVRVLGQQLVFVSFIASGQQARFRVGSCDLSKEHNIPHQVELVLLACRVGLHMALIRLAVPSLPIQLTKPAGQTSTFPPLADPKVEEFKPQSTNGRARQGLYPELPAVHELTCLKKHTKHAGVI